MSAEIVTIQLPANLYAEIQSMAAEEQIDPIEVIDRLVTTASQQKAWLRDLNALREQIRQDGGLQVGSSKDEVMEKLRQTRREIFKAEYAHLYQ